MIFLGDIASPNESCSNDLLDSFKKYSKIFDGKPVIANLEGLIADLDTNTNTPILFNHQSVIQPLKYINVKAVSLANNHTLDIPTYFDNTTNILSQNNIGYTGAGKSIEEAWSSTEFEYKGKRIIVNGFCWDVLLQHQLNPNKGVNVARIIYKDILAKVRIIKANSPDSIIVLKMHWSFDLETRPFPVYREFSRKLIDAGANAIIGSHSHCVQGAEKYNNGLIVYGLGNFYIPWYTFINGTIEFPEFSRTELAVEWDPLTNSVTCHWFKYLNEFNRHRLELIATENFDNGLLRNKYTPFDGMGEVEYIKWYKKNRRKKFLIPVYKRPEHNIRNAIIDLYLKNRIKFARILAKNKIRHWNN
jgi:hypothetical protein